MILRTFPTLIFHEPLKLPVRGLASSSVTRLCRELESEAYKFAELDIAGQKWCEENNYPGYTSYGSLSQMQNYSSTFQDLEKGLNLSVSKFIKQLDYDIHMSQLELNSLWINIMPPGGFHTSHLHPLSIISGTFYVSVQKGASSIKFEDPRLSNYMNQPLKKKQARQKSPYHVEISPQTNDVVLFESWLRHEVPQNLSKHDRISVSFNYGWKQADGIRDSDSRPE